jgi:hypothetical protein
MPEPIFLILGGESYELQPDFATLVALEESFGQPLIEIADIFIGGAVPLKLIAAALAVLLGWPLDTRNALGDEIVATGVGRVLETLQKFFLAALGLGNEKIEALTAAQKPNASSPP